ncbi:uncharacterized protein EDB93DRAFT_1104135 [Suillus bovinus]|uniref:uncharacterized protein n=1 Tax=Suillus bovinus TaxID=48563 RepID=UPI001B874C81|nr:uncharacterized protein EDB93DRAFT_1104135 [Suillus bovinus]KAG2147467.1 hypothetical protein EDB93DRAFT_1104135 [Suillus bovinus]
MSLSLSLLMVNLFKIIIIAIICAATQQSPMDVLSYMLQSRTQQQLPTCPLWQCDSSFKRPKGDENRSDSHQQEVLHYIVLQGATECYKALSSKLCFSNLSTQLISTCDKMRQQYSFSQVKQQGRMDHQTLLAAALLISACPTLILRA